MLNRSASLAMSTCVLKALPGKLDIKRHSPSIFYMKDRLSEEAKYACSSCDAQFRSNTLLAQHVLGKHGEGIFVCGCGKTFKWKRSLLRHQTQDGCKLDLSEFS